MASFRVKAKRCSRPSAASPKDFWTFKRDRACGSGCLPSLFHLFRRGQAYWRDKDAVRILPRLTSRPWHSPVGRVETAACHGSHAIYSDLPRALQPDTGSAIAPQHCARPLKISCKSCVKGQFGSASPPASSEHHRRLRAVRACLGAIYVWLDHFSRVHDAVWIEGCLHPAHKVHFDLALDTEHQIALHLTDTVLR